MPVEAATDADARALRDLIGLAEEIDARVDRLTLLRWTVFGVVALGALVLAGEAWLVLRPGPADWSALTSRDMLALAVGLGVSLGLGYAVSTALLGRRLRRERAAYARTAALVHEVFGAMGSRLTELDRAACQIRLGRLGL